LLLYGLNIWSPVETRRLECSCQRNRRLASVGSAGAADSQPAVERERRRAEPVDVEQRVCQRVGQRGGKRADRRPGLPVHVPAVLRAAQRPGAGRRLGHVSRPTRPAPPRQ